MGLLLGSAALLIAYAQVFATADAKVTAGIALPVSIMVLVGGSAVAIPISWRKILSQPLAVMCGIAAVLAPLVLPGPTSGSTAGAVLVTLLVVILLPTTALMRAGILLSHAALILICEQPPFGLWPGIAVALGVAYWLGREQYHLLSAQHRERRQLAETKAKLEAYTIERDAVLEDRQTMLIRQAEWATLGRMATGVAHEIKNPLQAAFTDLDSARSTRDLSVLDDVEVSLRRIDTTIREISRLRRDPALRLHAYQVGPLVDASLRSACMGLKEAHVRMGDIPQLVVCCDQNLLTDIFANLLTNAAHAAGRQGGVNVRVHGTLSTGDHALIYVDDDGPGIPEGQLDQVFEAFHTTKEAGKGTGLGLAISRKKMESMDGDLWAENTSSLGGARLVIALKLAPAESRTEPVRSPQSAPSRASTNLPKIRRKTARSASTRIHGTLLLIDDDAAVRRALTRTLSRNWNVLPASGSTQAVKHAQKTTIDVVLCDMHLLQEDAIDVLSALAEIQSELPSRTIFMTGEPTSLRLLALAEANPERLLEKPFETRGATRMMRAAMRGALPPLRSDDLETPPSLGALDPSWAFEAPTDELSADTKPPG